MTNINNDSMAFLEELILMQSPSGFEFNAQRLVAKRLKPFVDGIESDVTGNLIAVRNPDGRPRVMLAGHCDEVGLMVKHVSDEGFVYFATIGCPALYGLIGHVVDISGRNGLISGVVMFKSPEKNQKIEDCYKAENLWIDIGATDKKDAESMVAPGDPITLRTGLCRLSNDLIAGRAFDDRVGVFITSEVLRELKGDEIASAVYGVSTVQEEVGSRGAKPSAYRIKPDIGIVVEVIWATDYPETNKKTEGSVALGKGPVLYRGANINPALGAMLEKTAAQEKIPIQIVGYSGPTSTDASVIQLSRGGVATALVQIPLRYLHYPVETISIHDVKNAIRLLTAFIRELKPDVKLKPDYSISDL